MILTNNSVNVNFFFRIVGSSTLLTGNLVLTFQDLDLKVEHLNIFNYKTVNHFS